jgi:putative endonuclease
MPDAPQVFPPPKDNTWYIYAIECEDGSVYIGLTVHMENRWKRHLSGRGARWTKLHKPVRFFYYEEAGSFKEAWHKERDLKKHHRHWLKRLLRDQKEGKEIKPPKKKRTVPKKKPKRVLRRKRQKPARG